MFMYKEPGLEIILCGSRLVVVHSGKTYSINIEKTPLPEALRVFPPGLREFIKRKLSKALEEPG